MLLFVYDGLVNGDWISHYAVQLAAAHEEGALRGLGFLLRHGLCRTGRRDRV